MKVYCETCRFIRSSSSAFGGVGYWCVKAKVVKKTDTPLQQQRTMEDVMQKNAKNDCTDYKKSWLLERLLYANTYG